MLPNKRDSIWEKAASVNLLSVSNLESTSWKERFGLTPSSNVNKKIESRQLLESTCPQGFWVFFWSRDLADRVELRKPEKNKVYLLAVVDWTLWSLTTQTSESECVFFGSSSGLRISILREGRSHLGSHLTYYGRNSASVFVRLHKNRPCQMKV